MRHDPKIGAVKVGDTVCVTSDGNRMGGGTFTVASVGRKWFTVVQYRRPRQFSLEDGHENSDGVGGYCYAQTPEYRAETVERDAWVKRLKAPMNGNDRWVWEERLTLDQIKRLVAILEEP
jgi:hypothetical protein